MRESGRVASALRGEIVMPPVRGMTFIDPELLPVSGGPTGGAGLAAVCSRLGLDFCFVPAGGARAAEAAHLLCDAGVIPFVAVDGVAARCITRVGFAAFARRSLTDPSGTGDDLDAAAAEVAADVASALRSSAGVIVIADDLAGSNGPLLDPAFVAEAIFSRVAPVVGSARDAGVASVLHCDGDARAFYPSAAASGFLGVHGDCGGAGNIHAAFQAARSARLAFVGGIPTSALTDPATAALAGAMAGTMACAGGVLVSDDGGTSTRSEVAALFSALAAAGGE